MRGNKLVDLTGMRFNRWLVIGFDGIRHSSSGKGRRTYWRCLCSCGTVKSVEGYSLKSGKTKSCGCYNVEMHVKRSVFDHAVHTHMRVYRRNAIGRDIDFDLTDEEFAKLVSLPCYYCGAAPVEHATQRKGGKNSGYFASGIDRKDPDGPYRKGNCVPCCSRCNYSKSDMTQQEFIDMCKEVSSLHGNIGE